MTEQKPALVRVNEEDVEKSSPGKSECTYDTVHEINSFIIPVPVFIFYQTPNNFVQFQLPYRSINSQISQTEFRTVLSNNTNDEIKIQAEDQIILNNNNNEQKQIFGSNQIRSIKNQNKNRNVMSNLIKLLFNFVLLRQKSQKYLKQIDSSLCQQKINSYYKYTHQLKTKGFFSKKAYISQKKMKDILGISQARYFDSRSLRQRKQNETFNKKIMRILSIFYLNNLMVEVIIHSNRISKELRMIHLSKRNRLISILRQVQVDNKYQNKQ